MHADADLQSYEAGKDQQHFLTGNERNSTTKGRPGPTGPAAHGQADNQASPGLLNREAGGQEEGSMVAEAVVQFIGPGQSVFK